MTCAPNFPEGKVYTGYKNRWHFIEFVNGIKVVRVKTYIAPNRGVLKRMFDYISFMAMSFFAGLFEPRPDVIVGTSPQFFAVISACALSCVRRIPFIFELRDIWPATIIDVGILKRGFFIDILKRLELWLYRKASFIIVVTDSFKQYLAACGLAEDKVAVVANGVDLRRFYPIPRNSALAAQYGLDQKFVAGYIGTHGMCQGLGNVLEAARLLTSVNRIRFLFVGNGATRNELMESAKKMNLQNIVFLPSQPRGVMPSIWSLCDVALVHLRDAPVFRTVMPSKIFEAMGMGIPVICVAPEGEATGFVRGTGAGVTLPPENPSVLADAIVKLSLDASLLEKMRATGVGAAKRLSREKRAEEMLLVFERVVRERRGAA